MSRIDQAVIENSATVEYENEVTAQETAVLQRILKHALPAMPYISEKLYASGSIPGGQFAHWTYTHTPESAIILAGGMEREANEDANRGEYIGSDLIFTSTGQLIYRKFRGSWSNWQNEGAYWESHSRVVQPEEALRYFALPVIVRSLENRLNASIATAPQKRATLRSRLEWVASIAALLPAEID